ncbi:hypothetical protein F511_35951 [Dorcoceras hygrometricum]|uniref:Uncharacterized protein n=1 Tax=Dorcoceras hygrometricum TaxID=472368 RepID=A0A2Z7B4N6_9LAMI|nr:hypothetical protein F511_35951 [Dorcoceras hygrometricum]
MIKEYRKLSHSFDEIKSENKILKNSLIESSTDTLEDIDSLKTELSKLLMENEFLRNNSSELKAENERLSEVMSSWTKSSVSLSRLHESQKPVNDKSGLGFNDSANSCGETSAQSQPVYDKFKKMSFVKANVIHNCCESMTYNDQNSSQLNQKGKAGIGYVRPENKLSWLKNKLDKEKEKAGSKSFVQNHKDVDLGRSNLIGKRFS